MATRFGSTIAAASRRIQADEEQRSKIKENRLHCWEVALTARPFPHDKPDAKLQPTAPDSIPWPRAPVRRIKTCKEIDASMRKSEAESLFALPLLVSPRSASSSDLPSAAAILSAEPLGNSDEEAAEDVCLSSPRRRRPQGSAAYRGLKESSSDSAAHDAEQQWQSIYGGDQHSAPLSLGGLVNFDAEQRRSRKQHRRSRSSRVTSRLPSIQELPAECKALRFKTNASVVE